MKIRESMEKTRNFFHKTLQKFKSLFFGRYQKLPRSLSLNPLSFRSKKGKDRCTNRYYTDFCDEWECDLEKAERRRKNIILVASTKESRVEEGKCCSGSAMEFVEKIPLKNIQEEKKKNNKREDQCPQNTKGGRGGGVCVLAQKMKELEMADVGDMEQVLDIEEAIHYYSRLKSPIYVDMVNNFFTDMHSDFSVPQASATRINKNSKRRLGSIRF